MARSLSLAMWRYSIEKRTRKYVKEYGFLSFVGKYKKQLFDFLKTASKKLVHKVAEFSGHKIANTVNKSNADKIMKQEPAEEIIITPGEKAEMWNRLRQVFL